MNRTTIFQLVIIVLLVIVLAVIIIVGQQTGETERTATSTDATTTDATSSQDQDQDRSSQFQKQLQQVSISTDAPLGKDTITIGLPPWPGATVKSQVVSAILEKMGYTTKIKEMDPGIVYTSLADKQIDMTVAGWLPTTHESYWNEKGDALEIAGINVTTTWLGLGVPSYVDKDIRSLSDLKGETEFGKQVSYTITGIDPGAGVMKSTEKALEQYDLSKWTLQQSSAAAMLTEVQKAFDEQRPIIATVWQPHSTFAVGDLRKLKDPQNIYNDPEATKQFLQKHAPEYADADVSSDVLASVVYTGFKEDAPAAYTFLQNFTVPAETQSEWIYKFNVKDRSPESIAAEYIVNNTDTVQQWVPDK